MGFADCYDGNSLHMAVAHGTSEEAEMRWLGVSFHDLLGQQHVLVICTTLGYLSARTCMLHAVLLLLHMYVCVGSRM
jgi:hypothetical protein